MASYQTQSRDTSEEAERVLIERYRSMSPAEKISIFSQLWRTSQQLALVGLRQRHPEASDFELRMRLAALRLDRATLRDAFDWPKQ